MIDIYAILSAVGWSIEFWGNSWAFLSHVGVWRNGRVAWESHSVFTEELAIWEVWISLDTSIWSCLVQVKNVKCVNILGGELWSVNWAWE